ncbi:MAG: TolC family protein [Tannerella sp.]|jgi:outer membrane protein TolC|nr:TolC family protein [Tannerella sp.]
MKYKKMKWRMLCMGVLFVGISFCASAQMLLTIERALDIAEENNPDMKTQKLNLERALYNLAAQRASLKPQFALTVNPFEYSTTRRFDNRLSQWYTNTELSSSTNFRASLPILLTDGEFSLNNTLSWQDNKSIVDGNQNLDRAFSNNLNIRYDQPLFIYNRQRMALERLEYDYENAGIRYALQRLNTELNITRQFYAVYMAENSLQISQEELKNTQTNYDIVKAKVDAALSAREELFQAEVNLASAQSTVESDKATLENAKDALKQTLGIPLSEDITVEAVIDVNPILIELGKAVECGLTTRMELRQREIAMEIADFDLIEVKARDKFNGNLSLSVGITGDNPAFANIYAEPISSPAIAVSFTIPIFDWGQRKARIKASQTAQTIAKLDYDNQKVDIELEIRQTLRALDNLRTQIGIQEKNVENTQNTYNLNQIRYSEGDLTGLEISQYQAQLSNARTSLVAAEINYKIQLLNLKILTLFDFDKDQPIVPMTTLQGLSVK